MPHMRIIGFTLVTVGLLALPVIAQTHSSESFEPVATMKQLTVEIIYPSSNEIQLATSRAPTNDQERAAVKRSAITLAESGNLLIMRNRSGDWVTESRSLIEVGAAAYK